MSSAQSTLQKQGGGHPGTCIRAKEAECGAPLLKERGCPDLFHRRKRLVLKASVIGWQTDPGWLTHGASASAWPLRPQDTVAVQQTGRLGPAQRAALRPARSERRPPGSPRGLRAGLLGLTCCASLLATAPVSWQQRPFPGNSAHLLATAPICWQQRPDLLPGTAPSHLGSLSSSAKTQPCPQTCACESGLLCRT